MFFVLITKIDVGSNQRQSIIVDYIQHVPMITCNFYKLKYFRNYSKKFENIVILSFLFNGLGIFENVVALCLKFIMKFLLC